jgi:hypothetical protein
MDKTIRLKHTMAMVAATTLMASHLDQPCSWERRTDIVNTIANEKNAIALVAKM